VAPGSGWSESRGASAAGASAGEPVPGGCGEPRSRQAVTPHQVTAASNAQAGANDPDAAKRVLNVAVVSDQGVTGRRQTQPVLLVGGYAG